MKFGPLLSLLILLAGVSSPLFAHPGHTHTVEHGALAGALHPLLGVDHLLAMVAVGLFSAQLGGRALWSLPAGFLGAMIAGGTAALSGWFVPGIELGIAISLVVLGLAVAVNRRQPWPLAVVCVTAFGFVHGFAHGTEVPQVTHPVLYVAGFVATTAFLHAVGLVLGLQGMKSAHRLAGLRLSGMAVAAAGLAFAVLM